MSDWWIDGLIDWLTGIRLRSFKHKTASKSFLRDWCLLFCCLAVGDLKEGRPGAERRGKGRWSSEWGEWLYTYDSIYWHIYLPTLVLVLSPNTMIYHLLLPLERELSLHHHHLYYYYYRLWGVWEGKEVDCHHHHHLKKTGRRRRRTQKEAVGGAINHHRTLHEQQGHTYVHKKGQHCTALHCIHTQGSQPPRKEQNRSYGLNPFTSIHAFMDWSRGSIHG